MSGNPDHSLPETGLPPLGDKVADVCIEAAIEAQRRVCLRRLALKTLQVAETAADIARDHARNDSKDFVRHVSTMSRAIWVASMVERLRNGEPVSAELFQSAFDASQHAALMSEPGVSSDPHHDNARSDDGGIKDLLLSTELEKAGYQAEESIWKPVCADGSENESEPLQPKEPPLPSTSIDHGQGDQHCDLTDGQTQLDPKPLNRKQRRALKARGVDKNYTRPRGRGVSRGDKSMPATRSSTTNTHENVGPIEVTKRAIGRERAPP